MGTSLLLWVGAHRHTPRVPLTLAGPPVFAETVDGKVQMTVTLPGQNWNQSTPPTRLTGYVFAEPLPDEAGLPEVVDAVPAAPPVEVEVVGPRAYLFEFDGLKPDHEHTFALVGHYA